MTDEMREVLEHYGNIIDDILNNEEDRRILLDPYMFLDEDYQCNNGAWLCAGATRCAIVDDDYDWIVKFNLNDEYKIDYCATEAKVYANADKYGVKDMLVPCIALGSWVCSEGFVWKLYAYRRITRAYSSDIYSSFTPEENNIINRYESSPLIEKSKCVVVSLWREWGQEKMDKLNALCEDWDINDLHGRNIGYLEDRLVIFDYAGFHGIDDYDYDESEAY
jgi:hypothetical protein